MRRPLAALATLLARSPAIGSLCATAVLLCLLTTSVTQADVGWSMIKPTLHGPEVTEWEPVIWDPATHRLLYPQDGTLWSLSASTGLWSSTAIAGPIPGVHIGVNALLDAARNRALFFGGHRSGAPVNEVWELTLGASPAWRQLAPSGTPPPARWFAGMVLDEPGGRLIVFGGTGSQQYNDVWALSVGAGDGAWQALIAQGTPGSPSPRERHGAVFDSSRRRMVIFGGFSGALVNDVWALSLGPATPTWQSIATTGAPSPRDQVLAVYDVPNDRLVIQGGDDSISLHADAAALPLAGPAVWTSLPADPYGAQYAHGFAYDAANARILLPVEFATRALDLAGSQWSMFERHIAPRARPNGAVASDVHQLLITGGRGPQGQFYSEAWTLDLSAPSSAWQPAHGSPDGVPEERDEMAILWDPLRSRFLTFGGDNGTADPVNEVWSVTLPSTWTQLGTSGQRPPPGKGWRAVYDPSGDRAIVFELHEVDFCCPGRPFALVNGIYELPLSGPSALQWTRHDVLPADWRGRRGGSFSYDAIRDCAWLFGGEDSTGSVSLDELWKVDLTGVPALIPVTTTGTPPQSRQDHVAAFDAAHDQLVVFGGQHDGPGPIRPFLNDTWVLQTGGGNRWVDISNAVGRPPSRVAAASGLDESNDELVVYGGQNSDVLGDVWALPLMATLAVGPGANAGGLRLAPEHSNPVRGEVRLSITLPEAGAGSLDLLDVSGRLVRSVRLDGMDPGTHGVTLARRAELAAGIYFARLRQRGTERRLRLAVID